MTFQRISQRASGYLKTAETLLRPAQTMSDRAIAGHLKAHADDYQRLVEKGPHVDAAKATPKASGVHDLMDSITVQPAEEMCGERWDTGARPSHERFMPSLPPAEL